MFKFSSKLAKPQSGYRMGSVLGLGAFAEVRAAVDATGQQVAIKIIDASHFNEKTQRRVAREVNIMQSITHKHIIQLVNIVHHAGHRGEFCRLCGCTQYNPSNICCPHDEQIHSHTQNRDVKFLVLELALGGDLYSILKFSGEFSPSLTQYYFRQLVSGVKHLHDNGIIHRDLKPENIAFGGSAFDLKILDFGLATTTNSADNDGLFHSGVGSRPYSAPEVYYQEQDWFPDAGYRGRPGDVWSLAVILFVMLTNMLPFARPRRKDRNFVKVIDDGLYPKRVPEIVENLLSQIFVEAPEDRLTVDQIEQHDFIREPWVWDADGEVVEEMYRRARRAFQCQNNHDSVARLDRLHSKATLSSRRFSGPMTRSRSGDRC